MEVESCNLKFKLRVTHNLPTKTVPLPDWLFEWVHRFDMGLPVGPVAFTVDVLGKKVDYVDQDPGDE